MADKRKSVFLSYAHEDRRWAEKLLSFLAPWIRDKRVEWRLWDDSRIRAGVDWRKEIEAAIADAAVAVLLVTKDFLASKFIMDHELPLLLGRARTKELRLAWIAVGYSAVEATGLNQFQAVNDPERPLKALKGAQRDKVMADIAKRIADAVTIETFAGGFRIIDETFEPIQAKVEKRPERTGREFKVQATYEPEREQISFRGSVETITFADLDRLPEDDREFIADLQDSLKRNYQRWRAVRAGLGDAGGALDSEIAKQLTRITTLICGDLNQILDFLRKMHKVELEDHYGRYRHICRKVSST